MPYRWLYYFHYQLSILVHTCGWPRREASRKALDKVWQFQNVSYSWATYKLTSFQHSSTPSTELCSQVIVNWQTSTSYRRVTHFLHSDILCIISLTISHSGTGCLPPHLISYASMSLHSLPTHLSSPACTVNKSNHLSTNTWCTLHTCAVQHVIYVWGHSNCIPKALQTNIDTYIH